MLFNSHSFIFLFLPATLVGFFVLGGVRTRWAVAWLAIASLVFYGWEAPWLHVALLLASVAFNYAVGLVLIRNSRNPNLRKVALALGVISNLLIIGYFKYAGFLAGVFGGSIGAILLPLGISFFTFTQIAFLVDAYKGLAREYNPINYLLFVTYFPHLIAGPILHHKEMMPQFDSSAIFRPNLESLSLGLSLFVIGLAKKLLLADSLAPYADIAFASAPHIDLTFAEAWGGALAYTLQIYFDFSGYSDMAIGLSRAIGIRIPLNFNSPYKADSIIDFWRRWHMTLSRFLRDYLYFPLGGNRKGPYRRYVNLMITMLLGGLWHGAGWTFIIWGGLHGLYLTINHVWRSAGRHMPRGAALAVTFFAVVCAWVFFRAENLAVAKAMFVAMFGGHGLVVPSAFGTLLGPLTAHVPGIEFGGMFQHALWPVERCLPLIGFGLLWVFLAPNTQEVFGQFEVALAPTPPDLAPRQLAWRPSWVWGVGLGCVLGIAVFVMSGPSPFLYFRF